MEQHVEHVMHDTANRAGGVGNDFRRAMARWGKVKRGGVEGGVRATRGAECVMCGGLGDTAASMRVSARR